MEFNIKRNSTLPVLKMAVVKDGRGEDKDFINFIETSTLFFSMVDVNTGVGKIHMEPAGFVEKTFIDPNTPSEYYIYFKFQNKHINKVGRFEGQFTIKNESGTLILPIREQLFVNIIDGQGYENDNKVVNLNLTAEISPGSTIIKYTLSSDSPTSYDTTVTFNHILKVLTGDTLTVSTGITLNSFQRTNSFVLTLEDVDFYNLNKLSRFTNVDIFPIPINTEAKISETTIFNEPPTPTPSPTPISIYDAILVDAETYIKVGTDTYLRYVDPPLPSPTPTPTVTPSSTPVFIYDAVLVESDLYLSVGHDFYLRFIDPPPPTPTPTPTITPSPSEPLYPLTINVQPMSGGDAIIFDGITYTANTTVNILLNTTYIIEGVPSPGYILVGWGGGGVSTGFLSGNTWTVSIDFTGGSNITPQYEEIPSPTNTVTPTITPTNTQTPTPTLISCLDIATNSDGNLIGWNSTAFAISPNPAIGSTYPVGSQIIFQNGEIRTMVFVDDYSPLYMDIFYDTPISDSILFPIRICYPSIPTPTNTQTPTQTPTPTNTLTPSITPTITPTQGYKNGLSPETAGDNAYQIKVNYPFSTDGLYWVKNDNISGGTPFQIYADMTTDGGGWTLLMVNQDNSTWTHENAILYNEFSPVISGYNYSIISYGDYLKGNGTTFQYMMEAYERNSYGGIWTSPSLYTFVNTGNTQTSVTIDIKFGTWDYDNAGIEQRMPWYVPEGQCPYITTSESPSSEWWGSLMTRPGCGFNPAPWLSSQIQNPGIIWYWVRNTTPPPAPTPTPTSTSTQTPTPTPTVTPSSPKYYYLTNVYDCSNCQLTIPAVIIAFSHVPLTIDKFYQLQTSSFEILSVSAGPETNIAFNLTDSIGYDTCNESCGI